MNGVAQVDADQISLTRCPNLSLRTNTPKGRGIFATTSIPAGTIIEISPVLILTREENETHIEKTSLYHYTYNWPLKTILPETGTTITKTQAVVLGLGSLFNHSSRDQNVGWLRDLERQVIIYKTLREIEEGEELSISYGERLTFVDADLSLEDDHREDDEGQEGMLRDLDPGILG